MTIWARFNEHPAKRRTTQNSARFGVALNLLTPTGEIDENKLYHNVPYAVDFLGAPFVNGLIKLIWFGQAYQAMSDVLFLIDFNTTSHY